MRNVTSVSMETPSIPHPPSHTSKSILTSFPEVHAPETERYPKAYHCSVPNYIWSENTCNKTAPIRNCDCMSNSKIYKMLSTTVRKIYLWLKRLFWGDKVKRRYLGIFWTPSVAVESARTNVYQNQKKVWQKYD